MSSGANQIIFKDELNMGEHSLCIAGTTQILLWAWFRLERQQRR